MSKLHGTTVAVASEAKEGSAKAGANDKSSSCQVTRGASYFVTRMLRFVAYYSASKRK